MLSGEPLSFFYSCTDVLAIPWRSLGFWAELECIYLAKAEEHYTDGRE